MVEIKWGTKRFCSACNIRFYDMQKDPPICPKCKAEITKTKPGRGRKGKVVEIEDVETDDIPDLDLGDDLVDDLIEDVEDLGDDLDDVPQTHDDDHDEH